MNDNLDKILSEQGSEKMTQLKPDEKDQAIFAYHGGQTFRAVVSYDGFGWHYKTFFEQACF